MEFTPPGLPSEDNVLIKDSDETAIHKESVSSTDTDTPSGFEENDSDQDNIPPPPGFHRAPSSISGSSEASFNASTRPNQGKTGDEDNTFSHEDNNSVEIEDEVKLVEVELEEPKKKPSVKVPVQQTQQLTQRKQKKRGGGGRRRKGENRNRSKSVDKIESKSNSSFSITSLAVKFCGMSVVIGLFVILYLISVVILLSFNNP